MPAALAAELRKRNDFALPEQEAMLNVLRTAARLSEPFERLFREHGLSGPAYNILRILRGVGGEGVPLGEIAPQMVSPAPDVTRLVDRLEREGLAERHRGAADRRVVLVRIVAAGELLLAELDPRVERLHRDLLAHLAPDEVLAISELMVKARTRPPSG